MVLSRSRGRALGQGAAAQERGKPPHLVQSLLSDRRWHETLLTVPSTVLDTDGHNTNNRVGALRAVRGQARGDQGSWVRATPGRAAFIPKWQEPGKGQQPAEGRGQRSESPDGTESQWSMPRVASAGPGVGHSHIRVRISRDRAGVEPWARVGPTRSEPPREGRALHC